jgi:cytidylate kinase
MLAEEKGYSTERDDWWDTAEAKKFMEKRKSDPTFDKKVDKKLVEIVKKGGAVITSYTLPWLVQEESVIIKFWLRGSTENRAKRMANRDDITFAEAKKIVNMRDDENKKIYYKLYGFRFGEDLTIFDYMLNTDRLSLDSLIEISKLIARKHIGVSL